ncbi:hypothetical protein LAV60_17915 [Clostridium sporogenes]|jgi:hypothetical protein|uniref:hypothetical protein n=1 Tax=Clostridium sporogenes TaxID=1509 RepID=UPI0012B69120|nr:hypothetical protein [Clostridium sporogenes]MCW6095047.1 hypothetical protein [Clostridium sporogenes]MDU5013466.1 hypothetical protein [Clostridium botulinum]MDU5119633.1 hypothetical protein [Clostridium botulinum]
MDYLYITGNTNIPPCGALKEHPKSINKAPAVIDYLLRKLFQIHRLPLECH